MKPDIRRYAIQKKANFYELIMVWGTLHKLRPNQLTAAHVDQFVIDRAKPDWYLACVANLERTQQELETL